MVWQRLTADSRCDVHEGTVINYSGGGLYFETDHPSAAGPSYGSWYRPGFWARQVTGKTPACCPSRRWKSDGLAKSVRAID